MKLKNLDASFTIEATFVLPIFLFCSLMFLTFFHLFYIQNTIQGAILDASRELSQELYKKEKELNPSVYIKKQLDVRKFPVFCIKGGKNGISCNQSSINGDWIDLIVEYKIIFVIPFLGEQTLPMVQRVKIRGFVGLKELRDFIEKSTGNTNELDKDMEEKLVYMAQNGVVYHTNRDCSHIKLKIESLFYQGIERKRNAAGGKYTSCHICVKNQKLVGNSTIYYAMDGERYHIDLNCGGLKRTIIQVKKDMLQNISLCIRCEKNKNLER